MTFHQTAHSPPRLHPFVVAAGFASTFYVALLSPALPALTAPKGAGSLEIGLLFAGNSLTQFLTAPTWGALADRFGRRPVLLTSMCGAITGLVVFTAGAATGGPLWMLFAGWMLVGACDCWIGTAFAYVADTTTAGERTRFFAYLTAGIGSAFVIGPTIGALIFASGAMTPVYLLLGLLIAAVTWGYFSMPESLPANRRATRLNLGHLNPAAQLRHVLALPQLRILLLSYLLFWPAVVVLPSNVPTLMTDLTAWSSGRISSLLLIFGVLVVTVQLTVIPRLLRRFREIPLATAGAALAASGFVLFALFARTGVEALVYAGVAIFSVGQPLVQTCLIGAMSKSAPPDVQGRVQGAVAAVQASAQVIGSLTVGALYTTAGPTIPYATFAGLLAVAALLILAAPRLIRSAARPRSAPDSEPLGEKLTAMSIVQRGGSNHG